MKTSQKGMNLIKKFESLRLQAYLCPSNIWTIGYGHTKGVKQGDVITSLEAESMLADDLQHFESAVNREGLNLSQNQFDALVSFVFNVGEGNFKTSTLLKKVKANPNDRDIAYEFTKWKNGRDKNGKLIPLPGLLRRREEEYKLYFS